MKINLLALLEFFDGKVQDSHGHATAINAMMGEELGAGLLKHYFENKEGKTVSIDEPCTQRTSSGNRLDRWMLVKSQRLSVWYQVEIKNWSAHALGGKTLDVSPTQSELRAHRKERWGRRWNANSRTLRNEKAQKVLTPMKVPNEADGKFQIKPLICFWDAMHPNGSDKALFKVKLKKKEKFPELWVFSMSNYVRILRAEGKKTVDLWMPHTLERIDWLKRLS